MYRELGKLTRSIVTQKSVWKDGDFWTAIASFIIMIAVLRSRPDLIPRLRAHFGEALTIVSIIFGFVLTGVGLYVGAVANWSADPRSAWRRDPRVRSVSNKLVNWNIWTIIWILLFIIYVLALWSFDEHSPNDGSWPRVIAYSGLVAVAAYIGGQVLNHALTLSWFHQGIDRFSGPPN